MFVSQPAPEKFGKSILSFALYSAGKLRAESDVQTPQRCPSAQWKACRQVQSPCNRVMNFDQTLAFFFFLKMIYVYLLLYEGVGSPGAMDNRELPYG